jgi:hypothetical protein
MENQIQVTHISQTADAKVVVLFGGSPVRRDEVMRLLSVLPNVTIIGTLSEEEGMEKLKTLPKVDLVLIGGRYSEEQRVRIRHYVTTIMPNTLITEPGQEYRYDNTEILNDVKKKLQIK